MTQVTLLDTIELATFCVRTFSLHKVRKGALHCRLAQSTHGVRGIGIAEERYGGHRLVSQFSFTRSRSSTPA